MMKQYGFDGCWKEGDFVSVAAHQTKTEFYKDGGRLHHYSYYLDGRYHGYLDDRIKVRKTVDSYYWIGNKLK